MFKHGRQDSYKLHNFNDDEIGYIILGKKKEESLRRLLELKTTERNHYIILSIQEEEQEEGNARKHPTLATNLATS